MTQFWRRGHGQFSVTSQGCCFVELKVKDGFDLFAEGRWEILVDEAVACVTLPTPKREALTDKLKAELACGKVRLGEVSRARQCLTGSLVALGTEE